MELSAVIKMKERPFRTEEYFLKLLPVWYHEESGSSVIEKNPRQLAIHNISGNIFVANRKDIKLQVFDNTGHYLCHIPTSILSTGLCLCNEFIFVTTHERRLIKIQISNKKTIKSVRTENVVFSMDISSNIYGCEVYNQSVSVFDTNLKFLKRIPLKSPHFTSDTRTYSTKLYENTMYVMFGWSDYCLQLFSQDGQLIKGVIQSRDIFFSHFFSLDQFGNIIVADSSEHQIKIFSNSGQLIHTISNGMLTEDQKLYCHTEYL